MLGRPFLATARAIIDMKNGKLSLNIGEKKVEFNLSKGTTNPTLEDSYCQVEVIEGIREENWHVIPRILLKLSCWEMMGMMLIVVEVIAYIKILD